jgi:hypothetical protein
VAVDPESCEFSFRPHRCLLLQRSPPSSTGRTSLHREPPSAAPHSFSKEPQCLHGCTHILTSHPIPSHGDRKPSANTPRNPLHQHGPSIPSCSRLVGCVPPAEGCRRGARRADNGSLKHFELQKGRLLSPGSMGHWIYASVRKRSDSVVGRQK